MHPEGGRPDSFLVFRFWQEEVGRRGQTETAKSQKKMINLPWRSWPQWVTHYGACGETICVPSSPLHNAKNLNWWQLSLPLWLQWHCASLQQLRMRHSRSHSLWMWTKLCKNSAKYIWKLTDFELSPIVGNYFKIPQKNLWSNIPLG